MHFTSRPGLCGNADAERTMFGSTGDPGRTYMHTQSWTNAGPTRQMECLEGPTYLRLRVSGGEVSDVSARVARGFPAASGRVTELGRVPAREAGSYLFALAERTADGEVGEGAVFAATLPDSVDASRRLLRIARSEVVRKEARSAAVYWLAEQAGAEATKGLASLVNDRDQGRATREAAVFSLSQRPRAESVPELIRIARTHRDGHIRRAALFWLGQSGDPRAVALFEELLGN